MAKSPENGVEFTVKDGKISLEIMSYPLASNCIKFTPRDYL